MEYIVQIRGDNRVYPIPNGLYELMADITREVLRSQPQNLYKFIYNYLDAQIKTQLLTVEAMKILNEIIIDGQPMTCYLAERGANYEEANEAARKIQNYWKLSVMKKFRRSITKEEEPTRTTYIEDLETKLKTDDILRKNKLSLMQAETFAIKIQAVFRGYLTRKALSKTIPREESFASWDHDWLCEHFEDEESLKLIPKEQVAKATKKLLKYLPRRRIAVDKLKLKRILYGTEQDYERESTPSEEFNILRKVDRSQILRRPTPDEDEEVWEEELSLRDHETIFLNLRDSGSEELAAEEEEEEEEGESTEPEGFDDKEVLEFLVEEEEKEFLYEEELLGEGYEIEGIEEKRSAEEAAAEEKAAEEAAAEEAAAEEAAAVKEQEVGFDLEVEEEVAEEESEIEDTNENEAIHELLDYELYGEGFPEEMLQFTDYYEKEDEEFSEDTGKRVEYAEEDLE